MKLLTNYLLQLPAAFPDTPASSYGEFGVVSEADRAVSGGSFAPGM